jgi:hypothetical protein
VLAFKGKGLAIAMLVVASKLPSKARELWFIEKFGFETPSLAIGKDGFTFY